MTDKTGYRLAIDIGGTFTDTVLMAPDGSVAATAKTPTTPGTPAMGALSGARDALGAADVGWARITGCIHGTTLATNALIERRGACVATLTNAGFRDILEIAYERRYSQYDINISKPDFLVPRARALTIAGRMDARGVELEPLDRAAIPALAKALREIKAEAVAICLLHAYANPAHEQELKSHLSALLPDLVISLSHEVSPEAREFDRLCTTIANAYVQPLMSRYLTDFEARFTEQGLTCPVLMMTAGGGMTTLETARRLPIRLVESGPAGGAILAARIARETGAEQVLSFDMGGTTAKLCLIQNYRPQTARSFEISRAARFVKGSGMPVRIPVIEMIEIGAGGGSIATLDQLNRLTVGPQSAGAVPGPAAFAQGGSDPTVTDADVTLGYIDPDLFAEGRLRIDPTLARKAIGDILATPLNTQLDQAAFAVSEIVDENMASAARMHAVESGKDLATRVMIAFGGNGPLHATRVARRARISRILIPRAPGFGSAVGFLFAPVAFEVVRSRYESLQELNFDGLNAFLDAMHSKAKAVVRLGAKTARLDIRRVAFMRYHGQGHEIEIPLPAQALTPDDIAPLHAAFEAEYKRQFQRVVPGMQVEILNWAVSVSTPAAQTTAPAPQPAMTERRPDQYRDILCDVTGQWRKAGLFLRDDLRPGDCITGPALIIEPQTTTLVSADFTASLDALGNILMERLP